MNKTWRAALLFALAVASDVAAAHPHASSQEFVVELPAGMVTARSVVLVLNEVRLPKNAAVVLRARLAEGAAERPLGSIGVMAESKDAEGMKTYAALRIDITKPLLRWRQDHPYAITVRIRVVPYAGKDPLADLDWSAASAALTLNAR